MEETRVLYNDTCPVCSFEIDAYRRRALREGLPLRFDRLDQAANWGITPDQAARRLHVLHNGEVLSGIPAFRALWAEIPQLRWLARLTGKPFIGAACASLYDQLLAPLLHWMHLRRQARSRAKSD
jgi:predicted DCC family thiol-disulfide oxidoreductase YuxK